MANEPIKFFKFVPELLRFVYDVLFPVNLLSRVMPRYLTVPLLGTVILLMVTCGQDYFRSVKVTCVDFFH